MPSSYTTSLRLTLPATGELAGQWGNTVNTGITELLDAAVAGTTTISTWGGAGVAYTLSNNSGTADEARRMFIVATGTPGEAKNVICPAVSKFYVFRNDTTGGFALTLKTLSGTGVSVPAGQYKFLYCDGTNVVEMFNSAGALTLSGALSVGGTTTLASNPTLSAGTANQVQFLNASKVLTGSANLTFDGTTLTTANFADSSLTATRVTYAGASGNLTDSANFTFNGTDLTVSGAVNAGSVNATTLDLTNLEVTNIKAKDGTASMTLADATGVATFSANPILNAGTANGVLYLNGSKVATSGSALTFDGATLKINSAGNFQVGNITGYDNLTTTPQVSGSGVLQFVLNFAGNTYQPWTQDAAYWVWRPNGTEGMRLTSTGLGIGTSSPVAKLDVNGSQSFGSATYQIGYALNLNTGTIAGANSPFYGVNMATFTGFGGPGLGVHGYYGLLFSTVGTEQMRLDTSGNLGLGVTPSAWSSGSTAFQNSAGSIWRFGTNNIYFGQNYYWNGTSRIYSTTNAATEYEQGVGSHKWYTAPSGTAGNAISFTQAMTLDASGVLSVGTTSPLSGEKLDVNGGIKGQSFNAVGTPAAFASAGGASLSYSGSGVAVLRAYSNGSGAAGTLTFNASGSENARITSGGDLLVGTQSGAVTVNGLKFFSDGSFYSVQNSGVTSSIYNKSNYTSGTDFFADFRLANTTVGSISANGSTTSYSTSSDRRLKENIAPAADAGAVIDAIEVIQHDWKAGGHTRYGVVAQDLNAVAPEAVTQGDDGDEIERTWGVDYSKLVPMLIKEIQSLRARVAALEAQP